MNNLTIWLNKNKNLLINIRRHLHANPEIGYNEKNTASYLKKLIKTWGYKTNRTKEMGYGFIVDIKNNNSNTLAIRCDMDALPIQDSKNKTYSSNKKNTMHACGHDVHMTILLGLMKYLSENKSKINLRFLFQPAEECSPGGSIGMINGGAINNVDHILGYHVYPKLSAGNIAIKQGFISANVGVLQIKIKGNGGHTSRPEETSDLINLASRLILNIDNKINQIKNKDNPIVLVFGSIKGGHTFNVIPSEINLLGTIRYCKPNSKENIYQCIENAIIELQKIENIKIDWNVPYCSPGVYNDKFLFKLMETVLKNTLDKNKTHILDKPSLGGEDFAYYTQQIPGFYFRIGCFDGNANDLHCDIFDVDENCIKTGIQILNGMIIKYFNLN